MCSQRMSGSVTRGCDTHTHTHPTAVVAYASLIPKKSSSPLPPMSPWIASTLAPRTTTRNWVQRRFNRHLQQYYSNGKTSILFTPISDPHM